MYDHEFRTRYAPDESVQIDQCDVEIRLLSDLTRATYRFSYVLRGTPASSPEWFHDIPGPYDEVADLTARDGSGNLQSTIESNGPNTTKIRIKYRRELSEAAYSLSFAYAAKVKTIISPSVLATRVVYTDSFYHDNPCASLKVHIHLPEGAEAIDCTPPTQLSQNPITFAAGAMRPLDDLTYLLAYSQRKIGKTFWIWLGSTIASAAIGAGAKFLVP
jgi:hypothetical protein